MRHKHLTPNTQHLIAILTLGLWFAGGLFAPSAQAQGVTFVRSGGVTGTSFSFDIDSANTDRLVVVIMGNEGSEQPATQATVGGNNCNLVVKAHNTVGAQNHQEMWYCDEDDLGSSAGIVTVAFTGGDSGWAIHAHLYTGVSQAGFTDSGIDQTSTGLTLTVSNIDVPANGLVVMGAGEGRGGMTVSWTTPLVTRQNGPDPSSADLFDASAIETTAQTAKTYVATLAGAADMLRGTGIVAIWPEEAKGLSIIDWQEVY